jgi:hypothetical protein
MKGLSGEHLMVHARHWIERRPFAPWVSAQLRRKGLFVHVLVYLSHHDPVNTHIHP